jgi:chromosome segregation ATPase
MNELRECPFCESEDVKLFFWDNAQVWKLECSVCHVTYTHVDKERIIKFWNNRSKESALLNKLDTWKKEYDNLQYKLETVNYQTTHWHKKHDDMEEEHNALQKKIIMSGEDLQIAKTSLIDLQNKYNIKENQVNKLKEDIQARKVSYTDMQNKQKTLQTEVKLLKKELQTVGASYARAQNKRDAAQKALYGTLEKENNALQNKVNMLREDIQAITVSFNNTEKNRDALQVEVDMLKKDMQTTRSSYIDMQNKYDALQKLFDEKIKLANQESIALKTKINDEQKAHQYYMDSMQTRLNIAEEALRNVMSYNAKLGANKLEEYKIAHDALEKITKE